MVQLQQLVSLQCICCEQVYHPDKVLADLVESRLFGAEPYVVCPVCEQNVPDELRNQSYRRRWREALIRQFDDKRLLLVALLAIYLHNGLSGDEAFDKALKDAQNAYPDKTIHQLKAIGDEALWRLDVLRKSKS